jgi:hypothetical protein
VNNRLEFAGRAQDAFAYGNQVTLDFIESGKPNQYEQFPDGIRNLPSSKREAAPGTLSPEKR